ncbi:MAG: tRNA preQ1(34) S-adenosylmethionine ribosyltransferase-isomerase QueA [Desulfobulbus sp.]|nr:tRNA preQ1(34) S-adenosylmethionine ribosyltransferase-isomerase QueA [Desulfobulbus sp.]
MIDYIYQLDAYNYELPPERIAQFPEPQRDQSKLLVLETGKPQPAHRNFADITDYLQPSDLLVVNSTKVFPARLLGRKESGGKAELFLLHFPRSIPGQDPSLSWQEASATALIKSSKRPKIGSCLYFSDQLRARVDAFNEEGKVEVTLQYQVVGQTRLEDILQRHGQVPLPPYISRPQGSSPADLDRYQTRYAHTTGSVAAPTAGLHFSDALLEDIRSKGVRVANVVLHVGYGTFAPVRTTDIRDHRIHREWAEVTAETAEIINRTKAAGGRIWAVGTTTVRTLEFAAAENGEVKPMTGECDLFIYPGFSFKVIDNLITNFHLPKSSLLFLVSALAGRERILSVYQEAIAHEYRFFSYGDAMAIIAEP